MNLLIRVRVGWLLSLLRESITVLEVDFKKKPSGLGNKLQNVWQPFLDYYNSVHCKQYGLMPVTDNHDFV